MSIKAQETIQQASADEVSEPGEDCQQDIMRVAQHWGAPFGSPYREDYSTLRSMVFPCFGSFRIAYSLDAQHAGKEWRLKSIGVAVVGISFRISMIQVLTVY